MSEKPINRKDDAEDREEFDAILAELDKKFEPIIKALRDSERLTGEDMQLRINAKDEDL